MLGNRSVLETVMAIIPFWISLSIHEWAHARTAFRLGDDTAKQLGRMTLNPLAHIDLVGTVLLPLMGVPFAWAKPVPVQPHRFREGCGERKGMMIVALAGPLSNLALVALMWCLLAATRPTIGLLKLEPLLDHTPWLATGIVYLIKFMAIMIVTNVVLAAFNMLPIPPLDGSRVVNVIVPDSLRDLWNSLSRIGPIVLIAVLVVFQQKGMSLMEWPIRFAQWAIERAWTLY